MKFVPKQCKQCPFRPASAPGWLGMYSLSDIFSAVWNGFPFFCHAAINYQRPGWEERAMKRGKLCLGGLVAANRMPAPMRSPHSQIVRARGFAATIDSEVECMTMREFKEHHEDGNRRFFDSLNREVDAAVNEAMCEVLR